MDTFDVTYPPKTDTGWDRWGNNLADLVNPETAPDYGLESPAVTAMNAAAAYFSNTLAVATAPATISRYNTQRKRDALDVLKAAAKPVVAVLQTNPEVTDAQRTQLGIRVRSSPTPAPVPGRADVFAMLTGPTSIRVIASDPATPARRGKPRGVTTLALKMCVTTGEQRPPASVDEWPLTRLSGKATTDLFWPGMSAEATVWVCGSWVNSRMVSGEPSVAVSVRLPGTGLGAAATTTAAEPTMKIAA